jgi:hypothetical protein
MEKQINIKMNAETREKIDWLSQVLDENISSLVKRLILEHYEATKATYQNDVDFVRWIRSQRHI